MSTTDASLYNSVLVNATASGAKSIYMRTGYNLVNASLENALNLGTLKTDETQLSTTASLSRGNSSHYYNFSLDGDNLKMDLSNTYGTDAVRLQLYNSNGKVIADSHGTDAQKAAFDKLWSSKGLDTKAGDYTMRVTYAPTATRSNNQTYILSLYSGTRFSTTYQTTAVSQTTLNQKVTVDNTLTFSTKDAKDYSTKGVHYVGATIDDAINIGWLYENKSALKVTSSLTNVSDSHYYSMTLQKGETLKMAMTNKTSTANAQDLRVRVTDTTGLVVYADSHGTAAQKAAYKDLISSGGMKAKAGNYAFDVTYAPNANKNKAQSYEFYVYSGDHYGSLYETMAATESVSTAILSGHLTDSLTNYKAAAASYLGTQLLNNESSGLWAYLKSVNSTRSLK